MNIILYPPQNPVLINLFNIPIRYYGIIMSVSILVGILFAEYLIKKKYSIATLIKFQDSILPTVISAIIGARLFYVIGLWEFYSNNLNEIIKINHGGISIYGAITFGIIGLYLYSKVKKLDFLKYVDFYALVIPLCQSIGRFGNFFNQEAFGKPAFGFLKMFIYEPNRPVDYINNEYFHPTFLYESILDIVVFVILLFVYKNLKTKQGTIFYLYLFLYGLIRIPVEYIRTDSILNINNIPVAVIISMLTIVCGLTGVIIINLFKKES